MTEEQLIERLRSAGRAELASPSYETVDEAGVLLDRLDQGERLPKADWNRLADLAMADRVVSDLLEDSLNARKWLARTRELVFRLRPILAAAAVVVVAIGIGILYRGWPSGRMDLSSIQGWSMTDFETLGAKGGAAKVDPSNYEREFGKLRDRLSAVADRAVLERAVKAALATRNVDDAVRFARRWVEVPPDDPVALNALGLASLMNDDPTEALRFLDRAYRLDPQNADALVNQIVASALVLRPADEIRSQLSKLKGLAPTHRAIPELERWLDE